MVLSLGKCIKYQLSSPELIAIHVAGTAMDRREIATPPLGIAGTLQVPRSPFANVIFAHGSCSGHLSPRNMAVATALASRLADAVRWISDQTPLAGLPLGLFGASTGAAAALVAAAALSDRVGAVVSRGGHPDLAGHALDKVRAPTLLIVGGDDAGIIVLNEKALAQLRSPKDLRIVSGASHLFPEPVRLLKVPRLRRLSVRGSCANSRYFPEGSLRIIRCRPSPARHGPEVRK